MQDLDYVFREVEYYNLPRHEILQFNQRRTDNLSDAISQKSAHQTILVFIPLLVYAGLDSRDYIFNLLSVEVINLLASLVLLPNVYIIVSCGFLQQFNLTWVTEHPELAARQEQMERQLTTLVERLEQSPYLAYRDIINENTC